jgi:hypothetical protein
MANRPQYGPQTAAIESLLDEVRSITPAQLFHLAACRAIVGERPVEQGAVPDHACPPSRQVMQLACFDDRRSEGRAALAALRTAVEEAMRLHAPMRWAETAFGLWSTVSFALEDAVTGLVVADRLEPAQEEAVRRLAQALAGPCGAMAPA